MADEEKKETAKKTAPKKAAAPRRTARTTKAKAAEVKAEEAKTTAADEKITETKHIEAEKPAIHKEEKIMAIKKYKPTSPARRFMSVSTSVGGLNPSSFTSFSGSSSSPNSILTPHSGGSIP